MNILEAAHRWNRDHPESLGIRLTVEEGAHLHTVTNAKKERVPVFVPGPADTLFCCWITYVTSEQDSDLYSYLKEASMEEDPWKTQVGGTHYADMKIQPSEYITANSFGWFAGNVIKYLSRYQAKGTPLQDLRKARHYLDLLIAETEKKEGDTPAQSARGAGAQKDYLPVEEP